jgi:hypothetical protein
MSAEHDSFYDLAERIEDAFPEIDSDITVDLRETDDAYRSLCGELDKLQDEYPSVIRVLECEGAIGLTADEHAALLRYLDVKRNMEDMERKRLYFRGHTDGFAYLKRIGAI